jgi:hypothetical protein
VAALRGTLCARAGSETEGTCRWKAPWARGDCAVDAARSTRGLAASGTRGRPGRAEVVTEGVCSRRTGLTVCPQRGHELPFVARRAFRETGRGERGCSGWRAVKCAAHPRSEMPATAIRHRRGRSCGCARAHTRVPLQGKSRRSQRRKSGAWELETWRILVTTSRLQKLVRGIFSRRVPGPVHEASLE